VNGRKKLGGLNVRMMLILSKNSADLVTFIRRQQATSRRILRNRNPAFLNGEEGKVGFDKRGVI
jgi:hypothetical protein